MDLQFQHAVDHAAPCQIQGMDVSPAMGFVSGLVVLPWSVQARLLWLLPKNVGAETQTYESKRQHLLSHVILSKHVKS